MIFLHDSSNDLLFTFSSFPTDPFLGAVAAPLLRFHLCFGCNVGRESMMPKSRPRLIPLVGSKNFTKEYHNTICIINLMGDSTSRNPLTH